jgi:hypothetical protein
MEESSNKLLQQLDLVVDGFFVVGEVPGEFAYASAMIVRAYVYSLLGLADETDEYFIAHREANLESFAMIYPDDQTIQNQIAHLEDLREILRDAGAPRNELRFIPKDPKVQQQMLSDRATQNSHGS